MADKSNTLQPAVRLSVEARRQIAHDIEVAMQEGESMVDQATLAALDLWSPDGWTVNLKAVPRATET